MTEDTKKLLYVMTNGPENPDKTYAPIYTAALSAAMEIDTSMYFLMHAAELLKKGVAETVALKKGGSLKQFINMALETASSSMCARRASGICATSRHPM